MFVAEMLGFSKRLSGNPAERSSGLYIVFVVGGFRRWFRVQVSCSGEGEGVEGKGTGLPRRGREDSLIGRKEWKLRILRLGFGRRKTVGGLQQMRALR